MEFQVVSEKLGFALAVIICQKARTLPTNFWQTLTFDQWREIRNTDLDLKEQAVENMVRLATTLEQWNLVYICAVDGSSHQLKALNTFFEVAHDFENAFRVWIEAERNSKAAKKCKKEWQTFTKTALAKATGLARDYDDYYKLFSWAEEKSLKVTFIQKMIETAPWFDKCKDLYYKIGLAEEPSALFDSLFSKMASLAKTIDDWQQLADFAKLQKTTPYVTVARRGMMEHAKTIEDWVKVWGCRYITPSDRDKSWKKIERLAKTKKQWGEILNFWFCFRDLEKKVIEKLTTDCSTFDDWMVVYKEAKKLRRMALTKLLALSTSFSQCAELVSLPELDPDLRQSVRARCKELATTLDDWIKVYQMSSGNLKEVSEKLAELATTVPDIKKVLAIERQKTPLWRTLITRLGELTTTFDDCKELYEQAKDYPEVSKGLLTKLVSLAGDLDQAVWVYRKVSHIPEAHQLALQRMVEMVTA